MAHRSSISTLITPLATMAAAAVFSVAELLEFVLLLLPLRDLLLARSVDQDFAATIDTKKAVGLGSKASRWSAARSRYIGDKGAEAWKLIISNPRAQQSRSFRSDEVVGLGPDAGECSGVGSGKRWRYTAVQVTHPPLDRVQPEEMPRAIPAQTTERLGLIQAPNGQKGVPIGTQSDGIVARRNLPRDALTPRGNSPARVLVASRHGPMWVEWILYEIGEWRLLGRSVDETTGWEMLAMPDAAKGQPSVE
ncbi:hypothetical protein B0A55_09500 [Friedmanniomyces simplex]|uniref:Uncharacterized protein n=1 Tax=Friedmanniomyces simplex TaxID=329884 RepID=A0A4U0XBE1_9PEZI|nr:hypothetical protein B0A55_09500 [Friedmanniomyces simplex]